MQFLNDVEVTGPVKQNVWVLAVAGAMGFCIAPLVVFIGGIVGASLAPEAELSTLPVALLVVGTALAVIPVSRCMQAFGRKKVFVAASLFSALSAVLAAYAILKSSFWGFNLACVLLGGGLAVIQQYRFAAMESVETSKAAQAASFVLLGGLIAALLGPELAYFGRDLLGTAFAGSFLLLSLVCLLGGGVLGLYQPVKVCINVDEGDGRHLFKIMAHSIFWVAVLSVTIGNAVMSYIMTATPVSMHMMEGHSLSDTKWVIQSHIVSMFLPSLFSGALVARFGAEKLMLTGIFLYFICIVIALSGSDVLNYWVGLILLGLGWNFLFISGTVLLPQSHRAQERFKVQGFNDFFVFALQAFASISSGVVVYRFGWHILLVLAIPLLLVQLTAIVIWRTEKYEG
jgi:MFS family permease